jgi:serine protease Do/serine protease DegQ
MQGIPPGMEDDPFFQFFRGLPGMQGRQRGGEVPFRGLGSGFIISSDGLILTNAHVVREAKEVMVKLSDRREYKAKVLGADPATDIAVLKIDAPNLTAMKLGDSDQLNVGDFVIAIGNPFGLGQTVTSGIVSALGRSGLNIEGYEDFIQTDASINPGNSGGALINLRGELIGINTAIIGPSGASVGIGFAVPVNMARGVMTQLVRFGEVRRGRLGIDFEDLAPDAAVALKLPTADGALISTVQPDSPAAKAGLRRGDVVLAFNGRPVRSGPDLRNRLGLTPVGDTIELTVFRDGNKLTVKLQIAPPQGIASGDAQIVPQLAGLKIANIDRTTPQGARVEGVLVVGIETGSVAAGYGLRPGDVIAAVNRQRVRNINEFLAAMRNVERAFQMSVVRGDFVLTFTVR